MIKRLRRVGLAGVALVLLAGCAEHGFPEDQEIEGPFQITRDWQTIRFDEPLEIDRSGWQRFHLVVDEERYTPNSHFDLEDIPNQSNLRRKDGRLVKPEVVLIGTEGREVPLHAVANTHLYEGGLTIGFATYIDNYTMPPPFPEAIEAFRAVRVRSNLPFGARRMYWRMDNHPDLQRCGGRKCTWWDELLL